MSKQLEWETKFKEKTFPLIPPGSWWKNPTNKNSLRLKNNKIFLEVLKHFKFYKFIMLEPFRPKTLLQMEKYFTEPYYIKDHKTIYIHSEQDAIMLALHSNDLQKYLDNLSV